MRRTPGERMDQTCVPAAPCRWRHSPASLKKLIRCWPSVRVDQDWNSRLSILKSSNRSIVGTAARAQAHSARQSVAHDTHNLSYVVNKRAGQRTAVLLECFIARRLVVLHAIHLLAEFRHLRVH